MAAAGGPEGGVVSVFSFNGKALVRKQRLTPPSRSGFYGQSLALGGKYLAVSDPYLDYYGIGWSPIIYACGLNTNAYSTLCFAFSFTSANHFRCPLLQAASPINPLLTLHTHIPHTVYIYRKEGNKWTHVQTISVADPSANMDFGIALALSKVRSQSRSRMYDCIACMLPTVRRTP